MKTTSGNTSVPNGKHCRTHLVFAILTMTLIGSACTGGGQTPQIPTPQTVPLNFTYFDAALDLRTCSTGCPLRPFFLGSQVKSFKFVLDLSGLPTEASLSVRTGGGQTVYSFGIADPAASTPIIQGNTVVFVLETHPGVSSDTTPRHITMKIREVQMTVDPSFFLIPTAIDENLKDSVSSFPLNTFGPVGVLLIYHDSQPTRYFLSINNAPGYGAISHERAVILSHSGRILVSDSYGGFQISEGPNTLDVFDTDTYNYAKMLPRGLQSELLFTVTLPSRTGNGIASFNVTEYMDSQFLDYQKAVNAGASFLNGLNPLLPLALEPKGGCRLGQDDSDRRFSNPQIDSSTSIGGNIWYLPSKKGVVFGADCPPAKLDAHPEAYRNFELKNGWAVEEITKIFTTYGATWFGSEDQAEDVAQRKYGFGSGDQNCTVDLKQGPVCTNNFKDRQGFSLEEEPSPGATKPYLKAHIWADPPSLPDTDRALWVIVLIRIHGPSATNPYGDTLPCNQGFSPIDLPRGPACIEQHVESMEKPLLNIVIASPCNQDSDCEGLCIDSRCARGNYR